MRYYVMPMNRDPTTADDEQMGYHCGTRWINTITNRAFICTNSAVNAAVWHQTTVPSSRFETIAIPFSTTSTSYTTAATLPYVGSSVAALKSIQLIAAMSGGGPPVTFDLRITDASNQMLIAESVDLRNLNKSYFNVGTLSNVPSAASIFDIEVRRSGSLSLLDSAILYAIVFEYQ